MIKGFRQIASLTAFSRVLGMLRDMAFAYFLGAGSLMDGWVIAFKIPNLARRIFGEGAASSSFIPVYSQQLHEDPKNADKLASTVVTVIFLILALAVILGQIGIWTYYKFFTTYDTTRLMLSLMSIMLPYMVLICVVAILAGILNSHRHFAAPAAAPIVLNICIISSLCLAGWALGMEPKKQVFFVAIGVLLAGLMQIAIQVPPLLRHKVRIRPAFQIHSKSFKKIILLMGPMVLGLTVTQINTLADDVIAKCLSGSVEKGTHFLAFGKQIAYPAWEGAVSYLFYSQRLYQFPLGVLGISLATAIFPVMSSDAAKKDFNTLCRTIAKGFSGAVFVAIPAMVGLWLIGKPLISAIFQRGQFTSEDTISTFKILCFYAFGLCGYFSQQIATRAFYSVQDSKTPVISALIAVATNLVLNLTLIWFMGAAGLALSTAICSYLQVVILVYVLRRRFGIEILNGLIVTFWKTLAATVVMAIVGLVLLVLMRNLPDIKFDVLRFHIVIPVDVLRLLIVVPVSAASYALAARLFKTKALGLLISSSKS
jgi:putative peptidoglycan lipid II flippase